MKLDGRNYNIILHPKNIYNSPKSNSIMRTDAVKIKEEIIEFLRNEGPSLPIPIGRKVKMDSLFVSAFLSELLSNQKLRITNMKVGGSPVYYVPGTESGLEKFSEYLKSKEKEAFNLLREHKFLEDADEHPAIRVALRNIKDFAKHFEKDGKLIWRYFLTNQNEYNQSSDISNHTSVKEEPKEEVKPEKKEENISPNVPSSILNDVKKTLEPEKKEMPEVKPQTPEKEIGEKPEHKTNNDASGERENTSKQGEAEEKPKEEIKPTPEPKKLNPILPPQEKPTELTRIKPKEEKPAFVNPLAQKPEIKKPKEKPKSPFCIKVMEQIVDNGWEIVEEISHKAKEYNALVRVNSDLGPIIFMTQAKEKKTVGEADMVKLLGEAQTIPLPALFMVPAEPKKKAIEFLDKYTSVMKFKEIK